MDKIKLTLLLGLHTSGREKTFSQILDDANISYTHIEELEAASKLESLGLIQLASYQLPLEIRAELTADGKTFVDAIKNQSTHRDYFRPGSRG